MILYVNERNEIRDVNTTTNPSLIPIEITDENNPFTNWSKEKICCYRLIDFKNGKIKKIESYVDKAIIDRIDKLSQENESLKKANISTQAQLDYVTMMTDIDI